MMVWLLTIKGTLYEPVNLSVMEQKKEWIKPVITVIPVIGMEKNLTLEARFEKVLEAFRSAKVLQEEPKSATMQNDNNTGQAHIG